MRLLLTTLILCASALAADVVNGRLHLEINNLTGQQALSLRSTVKGLYQSTDLASFANWSNSEWSVETNGSVYSVTAQIAFKTPAVTERVWSNLVNRVNIPTNVTGMVSVHYCLIDPTNTAGWAGCDRAGEPVYYRERRF